MDALRADWASGYVADDPMQDQRSCVSKNSRLALGQRALRRIAGSWGSAKTFPSGQCRASASPWPALPATFDYGARAGRVRRRLAISIPARSPAAAGCFHGVDSLSDGSGCESSSDSAAILDSLASQGAKAVGCRQRPRSGGHSRPPGLCHAGSAS